MGAGKTTVGRQLPSASAAVSDSDHEIVARTGVPIPTIFEIEGEEGFRRREAQTIANSPPACDHRSGHRRRCRDLNPENRRLPA
jgi:shikimate kinase